MLMIGARFKQHCIQKGGLSVNKKIHKKLAPPVAPAVVGGGSTRHVEALLTLVRKPPPGGF